VPTTYYATVTGPSETTAVQTEVYETITSLCPVTETKTVSGQEVTVTYTTTSTYVTHAETTIEAT
jgi:hypothetical protein